MGRAAHFEKESRVRIEEAGASQATQNGARVHDPRALGEDMPGHRLFATCAPALLATELPVERIESGLLGGKNVLVPFDGFQRELRVHRLEVRHAVSVGQGW